MRKEGTSIPLSLFMGDLEAEAFYTIRKKKYTIPTASRNQALRTAVFILL